MFAIDCKHFIDLRKVCSGLQTFWLQQLFQGGIGREFERRVAVLTITEKC